MLWLEIECGSDRELLVAALWERGTQGIEETELPGGRWLLRAYFERVFDAAALGGGWRSAEDQDWVRVSREAWQPLAAGERFYLVPEWRDDPAPPGRLRLTVHPGTACGTGYMESTQLMLAAMERWLLPGERVLDVGTGSGILLDAAALLGAGPAVGCDIDYEALAFAARHGPHALFQGSLRAARAEAAGFVAANINAQTIVTLAAEIRRVLAPSGRAALGGFRAAELARVEAEVALPRLDLLEANGWVCLVAGAYALGG